MMKVLTYIALMVLIASCASSYNINGSSTVPAYDGRMLYLKVSPDGIASTDLDSCKVVHGRFNFYGAIDSTCMAQLYMGDTRVMPLVIEASTVTVQLDNLGQIVSGGPLNSRLYRFFKRRDKYENALWHIQQNVIREMQQGHTMETIEAKWKGKIDNLNAASENLEIRFIVDNWNNVLGPGFFRILCSKYPTPIVTEQIQRILTSVPQSFLENPYVRHYIAAARNNPLRKPFPPAEAAK